MERERRPSPTSPCRRKLRFHDYRDSILRATLAQLDSLVDQKEMVQVEMAKLCVDDEKVRLLMTINGMDYYSALLVISEIGDLDRFRDEKALCKYIEPEVSTSRIMGPRPTFSFPSSLYCRSSPPRSFLKKSVFLSSSTRSTSWKMAHLCTNRRK